ncbi:hypothetical protein HK101_003046 [Irineochytrium annulatum]|nr:hypothetical protein HK101_003046 [Irineochytrium annulatum]
MLGLALLLAATSAIASPAPVTNGLVARAAPVYVGCFAGAIDGNVAPYPSGQFLANQAVTDDNGVFTAAQCQAGCVVAGFQYSAVQVSTNLQKVSLLALFPLIVPVQANATLQYCWCGPTLPPKRAANCPPEAINHKATGNYVGGPDSYAVYEVLTASNTVPQFAGYVSYALPQGAGQSDCYGNGAAFSFTSSLAPFWAARTSEASMTIGICTGACSLAGYKYAAIEQGEFCFCGDDSDAAQLASLVVDPSLCSTACVGDANEKCGGAGYFRVFGGVAAPAIAAGAFPTYAGCFGGAIDGNVEILPAKQPLPNQLLLTSTVTVATCKTACLNAHFASSAVQTSTNGDKYCWCGDALPTLPAANCALESGGGTDLQGGVDSYAVYQVAAVNPNKAPAPAVSFQKYKTGSSNCYVDASAASFTQAAFPAWLERSSEASMTVAICSGACANAGFKYAGLENGKVRDPNVACGGPNYLSAYFTQ